MAEEKARVKCPTCGRWFWVNLPQEAGDHPVKCEQCGSGWLEHIMPHSTNTDQKSHDSLMKVLTQMPTQASDRPAFNNNHYINKGKSESTCRDNEEQEERNDSTYHSEAPVASSSLAPRRVKQLYDDIEVTVIEIPQKMSVNARLQWNDHQDRKEIQITKPSTVIGRKDPEYPSDIQFEDRQISRRSVRIDMTSGFNNPTFTLVVQKSTNPVFVNGRKAMVGEIMALPDDSTIQLGRTRMVFRCH